MVVFASDITERLIAEAERSQYANRMLSAMIMTVELLSKTVELKDPYTAGHPLRVASLADAIARELGTLFDSEVASACGLSNAGMCWNEWNEAAGEFMGKVRSRWSVK